jgi:Coenzyme PQQ synthesis protein D (PqqD)
MVKLGWSGLLKWTVLAMTERYVRNPKIEEAPLGSDIMLFDPAKSQFYVLNSTMAYLWKRCEGDVDMDGLIESVPESFALSEGHPVAADMKAGLEELIALGMISKA